jgi:hypothetical protein
MSEQTVSTSSAPKGDRSNTYVSCRLSYDCLMASTKSFVHNFNNLSQEEKLEFKSLNNYVKQLEKCMVTLRNNGQVKVSTIKRVTKSAPSSQEVAAPVVAAAPVATGPVVEAAAPVAKAKGGKPKKVVSAKEESSPTAQVVQEVQAEAKQAAPVAAKAKGKGKPAVVEEAVKEVVAAAAASKPAAKKPAAKKSA